MPVIACTLDREEAGALQDDTLAAIGNILCDRTILHHPDHPAFCDRRKLGVVKRHSKESCSVGNCLVGRAQQYILIAVREPGNQDFRGESCDFLGWEIDYAHYLSANQVCRSIKYGYLRTGL